MTDKPPSISKEHVQTMLDQAVWSDAKMGEKTTVVLCQLPNGFELVETSGSVDPRNYDHDMGVDICKRKLIDRVWHLEGYRLQVAIHEAR